MIRRPPICTLCPYTTLFRSRARARGRARGVGGRAAGRRARRVTSVLTIGRDEGHSGERERLAEELVPLCEIESPSRRERRIRSAEHTSELPSRQYLGCRLLL